MAVITYVDLAEYMNRTFTSGEQTAATAIIGALERELSIHLNRALSAVTVTSEQHILNAGQRQIFLKEYPVSSVTSFKVGTAGSEVVQTISDYDIHPWGIDGLRIATQGLSALVTYNAGMSATDTQKLEALMLRVSAREMSLVLADAQGLERLSIDGGTSYQFTNGGRGGFSAEDFVALNRFKRRIIG